MCQIAVQPFVPRRGHPGVGTFQRVFGEGVELMDHLDDVRRAAVRIVVAGGDPVQVGIGVAARRGPGWAPVGNHVALTGADDR